MYMYKKTIVKWTDLLKSWCTLDQDVMQSFESFGFQ